MQSISEDWLLWSPLVMQAGLAGMMGMAGSSNVQVGGGPWLTHSTPWQNAISFSIPAEGVAGPSI